jgi:hypothetical protein
LAVGEGEQVVVIAANGTGGAAEADALKAWDGGRGVGKQAGLNILGQADLELYEAGTLGLLTEALTLNGAGGKVGKEPEQTGIRFGEAGGFIQELE